MEIQYTGNAPLKTRTTDAGWDLRASACGSLHPGIVNCIHTGTRVKIPSGYFGRLVSRSSSVNKGIEVIDGTIDAGYTGELVIFCRTDNPSSYEKGDRLAQLLILPVVEVEMLPVMELVVGNGERGEKGFGSTGV